MASSWIVLFLILAASSLMGATHYISPSGTDSGDCTGSNCKTFAYALASTRMAAGDTLILRDGTYSTAAGTGLPFVTCGSGYNDGTAGARITVQAENERLAFLSSTGASIGFRLTNCDYWTVDGLRMETAELAVAGGNDNISVSGGSNLIFRNLLMNYNNRFQNTHLIQIFNASTNGLVEDSEFYNFNRHAIVSSGSSGWVFRRNYFNSRGRADSTAPGHWVSVATTRGDYGIACYPCSNSINENNISEANEAGFSIQSEGTSTGNQWLGNISISDTYGSLFQCRGANCPTDTVLRNFLAISTYGVYARNNVNTRCDNVTTVGGTYGYIADQESGVGGATRTFYSDNSLALNASTGGFLIQNQSAFLLDYPNVFNSGTAFSPAASDPSITNESTTDPALGSCRAWIPAASPAKGTGKGGADRGANILYQYQNGVLTSIPLWDTVTNNFTGCGAIIAGVNDVAGSSCTNVDIRLAIGTANGCAFPAGYGNAPVGGGTWLATDNFDSYTIGNSLSAGAGGSGWSGNWTEGTAAVTVASSPAGGQGGGALFVNADPNFSYSRTFADLSAGLMSFRFYINTTSPGDDTWFMLDEGVGGTAARGLVAIGSDGFVKIFDGTTLFSVGAYTANTWHTVTMEFNDATQPNAFRAKLGAGNFTQWFPAANGGSYSVINRVRVEARQLAPLTAQLQIDDIREGSVAAVVSTIALVDAGLTGSTMFVGEVKPLQWSTTDYTGNINLLASRDAGLTFQTIAQGVPDTGTYNWTVTGPASSQCRIKTCLASSPTICDTSLAFGVGGTILSVR